MQDDASGLQLRVVWGCLVLVPVGAAQWWGVCHVADTGVHKVPRQLHISALQPKQVQA